MAIAAAGDPQQRQEQLYHMPRDDISGSECGSSDEKIFLKWPFLDVFGMDGMIMSLDENGQITGWLGKGGRDAEGGVSAPRGAEKFLDR